jgi:uncharacterized protein (TIGR02444 family)
MAVNDAPTNPFWEYSLRVYGKRGVAEACIELQDGYGLDVNLILACLWSDAEGPGRLDSEQIRDLVNRTRTWQEKVVMPIRKVRRFCKNEPEEVPDELREGFRPGLQTVELDAERVEQALIFGSLQETSASGARTGDGRDAVQNLLTYLALQDISVDGGVAQRLGTIVSSAFPGADLAALIV